MKPTRLALSPSERLAAPRLEPLDDAPDHVRQVALEEDECHIRVDAAQPEHFVHLARNVGRVLPHLPRLLACEAGRRPAVAHLGVDARRVEPERVDLERVRHGAGAGVVVAADEEDVAAVARHESQR